MAAVTTTIERAARDLPQFAIPALKDLGLVGFGAFLGRFATKYFPGNIASSGLAKGALETLLGVVGLYFATQRNAKALTKIAIGVGADGMMQILEEIIP